tara:strand:+ start:348 stop:794 length:447 start_codon:yes stop_codon:yes gene_type:complete
MSTLVTNTITGLSTAANITIGSTPVVSASANSLTIRGEGSAQTSIQQGLAKAWGTVDNSGGTMTLKDSLNQTSITDNATSRATYTWANDFANDDYALSGMAGASGTNGKMVSMNTVATGSCQVEDRFHDNGESADSFNWSVIAHGDLA